MSVTIGQNVPRHAYWQGSSQDGSKSLNLVESVPLESGTSRGVERKAGWFVMESEAWGRHESVEVRPTRVQGQPSKLTLAVGFGKGAAGLVTVASEAFEAAESALALSSSLLSFVWLSSGSTCGRGGPSCPVRGCEASTFGYESVSRLQKILDRRGIQICQTQLVCG
jgi:hypothetical protein